MRDQVALSPALAVLVATLAASTTSIAQSRLAEWRLMAVPIVAIGGDGAMETEFLRISSAWRATDGTIVVVNGGSRELRYFSATGAFLRSFGRQGEGPGEFRSVGWSTHAGDTAIVYDGSLRRITWVHAGLPNGHSIRRVSTTDDRGPDVVGRLEDGRWLVHALSNPDVNARGRQRPTGYAGLLASDASGRVEWLAEGPDLSLFVSGASEKMVSVGVAAFPASFAMSASGRRIWLGDRAEDSVTMIDAASGVRTVVRLPDAPTMLTRSFVAAERAGELDLARTAAQRRMVERKYEADLLPDRLPAFGEMVPGLEGSVWVERLTSVVADSTRYVVISPNGSVVARVTAPPGFRVTDVGSDVVVGVHRDGDGVETVRAYRLTR